MWHKLATAASVRPIRLHDARHSCGTALHLRGVPLAVIAKWLGHADAATTARIYAHSQDDALQCCWTEFGRSCDILVTPRVFSTVTTQTGLRKRTSGPRYTGAPGRIRTCGLLLRRQTLYPLSYGGAL